MVKSLKTLLGESRSMWTSIILLINGTFIAWVAQSALKYRPRICELSKCLKGPLKMNVCPKKNCHTFKMPLDINAGSDRWPVRLQTRAVVIITETDRDFEDDKSVTNCPRSAKFDTAYDVGSFSGRRNFGHMVSLDGTGVLSGVEPMLATFWCRSSHSSDCTILAIICVGRPDPVRRYTLPLLPTPSKNPTEVAADTSIRPTCFLKMPLSKSVSCSYCRRLRLRGILSLNIVYQSHQIRLDSRIKMLFPSCATNMRVAHLALEIFICISLTRLHSCRVS
ncbi:hypothetical protein TNCV_4844331 [Trichonephila clavipes]|uniref:Uncharacterized protein n=1 Tax=Trichonephila clavipes TaxID=2585209 RepID=A0A8X7BL75_TRICX|nr:hypothetical protein TNCV_4844331 [Trichonephila clavipes]